MEDYATTTPWVQPVLAAGFKAGLLLGANEEFLIDQYKNWARASGRKRVDLPAR